MLFHILEYSCTAPRIDWHDAQSEKIDFLLLYDPFEWSVWQR